MIEILAVIALQGAPAGGIRPPDQSSDPYYLCRCPQSAEEEAITFTGYASDAQLTLGADGRSVEARQATLFRVAKKPDASFPDPAKIWHVTDPAKCGVKFDYGKRYVVTAVKKPDGEYETNYCLMKAGSAGR